MKTFLIYKYLHRKRSNEIKIRDSKRKSIAKDSNFKLHINIFPENCALFWELLAEDLMLF